MVHDQLDPHEVSCLAKADAGLALERSGIINPTGEVQAETVYGMTSLASHQATLSRLLELVRGPWQIENHSHGVRDVTCDNDRSPIRCGPMPQVMAA